MRIGDFVRQALGEIVLGVAEAKRITNRLSSISPGKLDGETLTEKTLVDFEIALLAENSISSDSRSGGEVSGSLRVVSASVSGSGETSEESRSENVSRVSFSVPLYLNAHHRNDSRSSDTTLEDSEIDSLREILRGKP